MDTPEAHLVIGLAWLAFIFVLVVNFGWKDHG